MYSELRGLYRNGMLTNGTDWTGPKPDGPATGSEIIGLVIPELVDTKPPDVHVDVAVLLVPPPPPPEPKPEPPREDGMSGDRFCGTEFTGGITIDDAVDNDGGTEFTEFELIVMFIPGTKGANAVG